MLPQATQPQVIDPWVNQPCTVCGQPIGKKGGRVFSYQPSGQRAKPGQPSIPDAVGCAHFACANPPTNSP